ncbi:MAG: cobaltochelatase subunit CobN [Thainema sp.]
MHRIAATPGGWNPDQEGVVFIDQTPAAISVLTAADTEIQLLARALSQLPDDFPTLRTTSLLNLQQQLTIDTYAEDVLEAAQIIVLRLLGGRTYWSYGLEVLKDTVTRTGAKLVVLPGDDRPDPDLISHSTVPLAQANRIWRYFTESGLENVQSMLLYLADLGLGTNYQPPSPQVIPKVGRYVPSSQRSPLAPLKKGGTDSKLPLFKGDLGGSVRDFEDLSKVCMDNSSKDEEFRENKSSAKVGILFYRAHYLAGNTAPVDALCDALTERGLEPVPIFVSSPRDLDVQDELLQLFQPKDAAPIQVLLNATSFSVAQLQDESPNLDLWRQLNVPVLQTIFSGGTLDQWQAQTQGLSPRDTAMNVALPEVDGRIITRAVSFKAVQGRSEALETDIVGYEPLADRVQFVADLALNWVNLRQTPVCDRKIALILANYPTRDGRLANGVGLDTPASCLEILKSLQEAGYTLNADIPTSTADLIQRLTAGVTNDAESRALWQAGRREGQQVAIADYQSYFSQIPQAAQQGICDCWGDAAQYAVQLPAADTPVFPVPGIYLGNVFVGIQPARGYDLDPALNYHAPDLEPPHTYLAFYHWVRHHFGAQAIVHVGKHGNLEWLPGKSIALSESCYPEVALGPLPHLYPFIVNDPGEGSQAKRRAQAVILDHLTPPLTRAELYGPLEQLEQLVDEYYEAQTLDPSRLGLIRDRIFNLVTTEHLIEELSNPTDDPADTATLLTQLDGYLCELKEAQIRDGLHIYGQCPQGRQLRDLIIAIARSPAGGRMGLTRAIAQAWNLDIDPLTQDFGEVLEPSVTLNGALCRTVGDVVEQLEIEAARLVEGLLEENNLQISEYLEPSLRRGEWPFAPTQDLKVNSGGSTLSGNSENRQVAARSPLTPLKKGGTGSGDLGGSLAQELQWIATHLLPALQQTRQEITQLIRGLSGEYVPSGPSGAPTRGRPEVLPTGRNFYSVDIRAIPTESAWSVGRKAAEVLIARYTQEQGEYPKTLGLSVWGTSTMRTGGDDWAEALALLGVQPVWDGPSRRVVDFEILPLSILGRPRVDVTLRISGFFRDAFPNLIDLFDQAVEAVASLDEPADLNPLADRVQQETADWIAQGLNEGQANVRSRFRIFGSKPGAYGAGLQGLIEAQNWTDDEDLARAYINWSSYAYGRQAEGRSAPEAFQQRLQQMQIVLHNQDNREHDLLDSDDYYQFQGGLTAAIRATQGQNPVTYFGDHAQPENPKVRRLQEEIARVYRSRVVNPKWISGVMRHGYKGAFEMAATLDYLFAYDATTHCVADYMYEGLTEAYMLDPHVQEFIQQHNPWALRDMAERLLEAEQRGLWQSAPSDMLEQLRAIAHQAEADIEART